MKVPHSGVAVRSPNGVTRFGLGIGARPCFLQFLDPLPVFFFPVVQQAHNRQGQSGEAAEDDSGRNRERQGQDQTLGHHHQADDIFPAGVPDVRGSLPHALRVANPLP
jgi:hypothetical protein